MFGFHDPAYDKLASDRSQCAVSNGTVIETHLMPPLLSSHPRMHAPRRLSASPFDGGWNGDDVM